MNASVRLTSGEHTHLDVVGVGKTFKGVSVMSDLDFRVQQGELVSLLGPSGCGKTTLLRIIAGLTAADTGDVILNGQNVSNKPAHQRNISVVFQSYALFPHLNVAENVAFGLRARGGSKADMAPLVSDALTRVRMHDYADRPVTALSGGQQQRVAVARALIVDPVLLLLDEPFSALDRKLREAMQVELKSLLRERGMTAIFVTHDQEEAMAVSDRIAIMNAGRIEQFATPSELYARPATPFVMDFIGLSLRLFGTVVESAETQSQVETRFGRVSVPGAFPLGQRIVMGVRPELVAPMNGENTISVTLSDVMILGAKTQLHGVADAPDRLICELPGMREGLVPGQELQFGWSIADTLAYEAAPHEAMP